MKNGLVTKTHNRFYEITLGDKTYLCSPKGNIRRHEDPDYRLPVIGDKVEIQLLKRKQRGVDGHITALLPRDNMLKRALPDKRRCRVMAANLSQIFIVGAPIRPGIDWGLVDRYLLTCELAGIHCSLVLNKADLDPGVGGDPMADIYRDLDIPVLETSVKTGQGLDELRENTGNGICLFTGNSGVGKSSLINYLVPEADLTTGEVDAKRGHGKHTTTNSMLVPLGPGSYLADSPGIREFAPPPVEVDQVRFGYREIAAAQGGCRFTSCLHDSEPHCAVVTEVEEGTISYHRYRSYLAVMEEMREFFRDRYN